VCAIRRRSPRSALRSGDEEDAGVMEAYEPNSE
jgi:hypothetical protein